MKTYIYIFVMAVTTYIIRVLPLTLIRKPIKNKFFIGISKCKLSDILLQKAQSEQQENSLENSSKNK